MTNVPTDRDREVPPGTQRKPLRTHSSVRDYLKQRTEGSDRTISQELNGYLPADWDELEFGYGNAELAHMKVTPQTKERIVSMTGSNVSQGDVVALFVLLGALENDDIDVAEDIAVTTPELVWDLLNVMSETILKTRPDDD